MNDQPSGAELLETSQAVVRATELADRITGDAVDALRMATVTMEDADRLLPLVRDAEEAAARAMVRAHAALLRLGGEPEDVPAESLG